jgi:hypothetical protein
MWEPRKNTENTRKDEGEGAEDLVRGAELFSRWRRSRAFGARIPLELWQVALGLGRRRSRSWPTMAKGFGSVRYGFRCRDRWQPEFTISCIATANSFCMKSRDALRERRQSGLQLLAFLLSPTQRSPSPILNFPGRSADATRATVDGRRFCVRLTVTQRPDVPPEVLPRTSRELIARRGPGHRALQPVFVSFLIRGQ